MRDSAPRVLLLTMMFPPPVYGGSLVYLQQLWSNLSAARVITASSGDPVGEAEYDAAQPYQVTRLPIQFAYGKAYPLLHRVRLAGLWWLTLLRQIGQADVVAVENPYTLGIMAWLVGGWWRKPYIVFAFGEELAVAKHSPHSLRNWLRRQIYAITLRSAAVVISISASTTELVHSFGAKRVQQIYPPTPLPSAPELPTAEQVAEFRHRYQLGERRVIASVGRLIRRKGHDYLLQALPPLIVDFPDLVLVIASAGALEAELRQFVERLGLHDHVRFLGAVDRQTLSCLYTTCELFVLPNRTLPDGDQEGYGIVFNEANAFGKPAIGGNSGGTPDAILDGQTGLLIDSTSVEAITAALRRLLSDPAWAAQLGLQAREWIAAERSPRHSAAQFQELLVSLTQKPKTE